MKSTHCYSQVCAKKPKPAPSLCIADAIGNTGEDLRVSAGCLRLPPGANSVSRQAVQAPTSPCHLRYLHTERNRNKSTLLKTAGMLISGSKAPWCVAICFFFPPTQLSDLCQKITPVIWSGWFEVMSIKNTYMKCTFKK